MYLVFARKYRPHTFDDVVGQEHIAKTLKNAVRQNRVAHAYLFCGSRGVGKTSMARILAAALNCKDGPTEQPCGECDHCKRIASGDDLDVMEIDGASNRGIDEVRELRQNAKISPSSSRYKIYYIDEVHMLTQPAFNALLKTLEEPPPHVKFIFSTTDPQQLPDTVKSRCQRFDFRRISDVEIIRHLKKICKIEGLTPEKGALQAVARAARGGMRDALGTLDQVTAFSESEVELENVLTVLGAAATRTLTKLVDALAEKNTGEALKLVHDVLFGGIDLLDFIDQLSEYLRDVLVANYCRPDDELLAGAIADSETLTRQAQLFTDEQLLYMLQILREARLRSRRDTTGKLALEMAIIKLSRLEELVDIAKALENQTINQPPVQTQQRTPVRSDIDYTDPNRNSRAQNSPASPSQQNNASAEQSGGAGSGRVKAMMQRLQQRKETPTSNVSDAANNDNGRKQAVQKDANNVNNDDDDECPHGIEPRKFRQLQGVAQNSTVARDMIKSESLMKAFAHADARFDLQPVKLSRKKNVNKNDELSVEDEQTQPE